MPYITQQDRLRIHGEVGESINALVNEIVHPLDVHQVIYHLMWIYLSKANHKGDQRYPVLEQAIQNLRNLLHHCVRESDFGIWCNDVGGELQAVPGEFNYIITYLIHHFLLKLGVSYTRINNMMGIIERTKGEFEKELGQLRGHVDELSIIDDVLGLFVCIQLELYRILAAFYENRKLLDNGPVSDLDQEHILPLAAGTGLLPLWRVK
jgi:hypothetical protein